MARKFGRVNEISLDPLAYNIGIIGESGIGKSTLVKEVCEKLVGKDGYIALDIGKECGHGAVHGINSEPCPDWDKLDEIIEDIVDNRFTDYKDLKIVIFDTIDQLFAIAEPKVIKMHNRDFPEKRTSTIKAAYGGFMGGEDKAIEIVLDKMWELKNVGVSFIIIGHTKKRDIEDVMTGQTYSTLTTNISQRYFNAIKTKLDVLGVAYINREIVQRKTGKKNIVTKQEEVKGKILSESRQIAFRDDSYSIDSKSRFADITPTVPLDSDAFIKALEDAIHTEHSKSGKSIEDSRKEQAAAAAAEAESIKENIKTKKKAAANGKLIEEIKERFADADDDVKVEVRVAMAEHGIKNFRDDDLPTEGLEDILNILSA